MATDITRTQFGVVTVTVDTDRPKVYARSTNVTYAFNAAGTILNLSFGVGASFAIPLASLTVTSIAPANVAAAYTALAGVFQTS